MNYRTGPKSQTSKECLIEFQKVNSASMVSQLLGQKVTWKKGNCTIVGKVMGPHGKNGMVRVKFTRGVPGQAIGTIVETIG